MKKNTSRLDHLIFGISAGAIASCLLFYFANINSESTVVLTVFNFLFVSLIFPLTGTLKRKLCMLAVGNFIGLVWNHIFFLFVTVAVSNFGDLFEVLYLILNPFLNLIWIVSFWSLSLTFLNTSKRGFNL